MSLSEKSFSSFMQDADDENPNVHDVYNTDRNDKKDKTTLSTTTTVSPLQHFSILASLEKIFSSLSPTERNELFANYNTNFTQLTTYIQDLSGHDVDWQKYLLYECMVEEQCHHQPPLILDMLYQRNILWNHTFFQSFQKQFQEQDDFIEQPPMIEEGLFECRKCKSRQTFSFSKQTRRADEGTTVFVRCSQCQFTYKMN